MSDHRFTSSPWGFRYYGLSDYCRFMKGLGITDLCLMFGDPATWPLALPSEGDAVTEAAAVLAGLGVSCLEVATTTGAYDREIPLAAELGARYYRIVDGWERDEESFRRVTLDLQEQSRRAAAAGVTIIVENHGGLLTTGANTRRFFEAIGASNVLLNYDPANYRFYGQDPLAALDDVLPLVAFTHFKNVRYDGGKLQYCRLRDGVIDYVPIFARLLPGYSGYIGLEYERETDAEAGTVDDLGYLRRLLCGG